MTHTHVSDDPQVNWENDAIQFPRLIAELEAAGVFTDVTIVLDVANSMDVGPSEIHALVDRAVCAWDVIKARTKPRSKL